MAESPVVVDCYSCGAKQDPSRDSCSKCHAVFERLCECGAQCSMFVPSCPKCGRELRRLKGERPEFPVRAVLIALAVLALVAAIIWAGRAR